MLSPKVSIKEPDYGLTALVEALTEEGRAIVPHQLGPYSYLPLPVHELNVARAVMQDGAVILFEGRSVLDSLVRTYVGKNIESHSLQKGIMRYAVSGDLDSKAAIERNQARLLNNYAVGTYRSLLGHPFSLHSTDLMKPDMVLTYGRYFSPIRRLNKDVDSTVPLVELAGNKRVFPIVGMLTENGLDHPLPYSGAGMKIDVDHSDGFFRLGIEQSGDGYKDIIQLSFPVNLSRSFVHKSLSDPEMKVPGVEYKFNILDVR